MIGLLALTALPTTIAVAEGVSTQKKAAEQPSDEKLLRKFQLRCFCDAKSQRRGEVHGGRVVVGEGKVWIAGAKTATEMHTFEGFYVQYPDEERPPPVPLGLVSTISDDPPMLNWIYVDKATAELRHGNRTQSRAHHVGPWGWIIDQDEDGEEEEAFRDEDEDGGGGGVTMGGEERFVVVEPVGGGAGLWEVRWDEKDDGLKGVGGLGGRRVLRCSLDRVFVEERKEEAVKVGKGAGPKKMKK